MENDLEKLFDNDLTPPTPKEEIKKELTLIKTKKQALNDNKYPCTQQEALEWVRMQDRFKFRIWDKKLNKLAEWGDNPYHNMEIMNYICVENPITDWKHEDYILMQCTGLKDKNGKLIYEGDIINISTKKMLIKN